MRHIPGVAFFLCTMLVIPLGGQQPLGGGDTVDPYNVNAIRLASQLPPTSYVSYVNRVLPRMGDRAAIAILKSHANLSDDQRSLRCLEIIHIAFSDPPSIEVQADKSPEVTLLLLRQMAESTTNTKLRKEIAETTKYVERQTAWKQ